MHKKLLLSAAAIAAITQVSAEDSGWKSTAGINVAITRGNSSSTLVGGNILTGRKWDQNELSFGLDGAYGKANGAKNVENFGGFGQYNRLLTDRWYLYAHGDIRRDTIAAINYRATLSPGVGYYFIKGADTTLSLEAGPGVVFEKFKGASERSYFTLRVGEKFTHKFNEHVSLTQYAEYQPQIDDFGNYVVDAGATLSAKIVGNLAATLTLRDIYRSHPAPSTPPAPAHVKNDVQILAGLAYSF